ncbi:TraE/TraK family type IV conjugative transfer system protein [Klebsiella variicola]|uniref:TraE/TraK family type IV conjugative transfer system protein n=1 Tax=Klebsiella variicola TaxID=244366 RepID=UPI0022E0C7FF|nr:TraE/TraK family type IV conjugative transfer system protein [Klebsiella variicola]
MEHGARQNTTRVIAVGFISLGTLLTLSLATNIIQGINNYRLQTEQKVAVTPMLFRAPFAVSQNQADASYIEQLGLSFVALRLNVTPETVDAQHDAWADEQTLRDMQRREEVNINHSHRHDEQDDVEIGGNF